MGFFGAASQAGIVSQLLSVSPGDMPHGCRDYSPLIKIHARSRNLRKLRPE
jgi:hypothetical protein